MVYDYRTYAPLPSSTAALVPTFAGMGLVDSPTEGIYPRHRHRDYEVIVVERGEYRCVLNDVRLQIPGTRCLVVKPGDQHEDLLVSGGRHVGVWFRLGLAGDAADLTSLPLFAEGVLPEQQVVACDLRRLTRALFAEYSEPDLASAHLQEALLAEVFWQVVRAAEPNVLAPGLVAHCAAASFPARWRAALARHGGAAVAPAELAKALGLGERALREACRVHLGTSPARAIMAYRLERAAELLRSSGLNVAQVAERLGFANPFHFARAFRRQHGVAPSLVRAG
jgi:AraC-like DNA-binding protein